MKILAVVGSPRKEGNSSILTREALKPFQEQGIEAALIYLSDYDFQDCNGCEGCKETYKCVIDDGMQDIYPLILESDALIVASPAYFYNITAHMKAFIDRCYCFVVFDKNDRSVWMSINEASALKYAVVIAVCEQDKVEEMGYTAEAMEKPLEALGYRVIDTVKALRLFAAGEALGDEKVLRKARQAGEKLLKTLRLKERLKDG